MKLEKLKPKNTKKKFIIGLASIAILSAGALTLTHAKYKTSESIEIANGTINYELADTNLIGVYIQNGEDYTKTDTIPEGYVLNEEESYCKVNNEVDNNISITYDTDSKTLSITPMTTKGTKCYLYFDEKKGKTMSEIIAGYNVGSRGSFSSIFTSSTPKTVYTTTDWTNKTSYYFAGNPTDNWVQFAGYYWRIIRVNGDGSTRMIYAGTSTSNDDRNTDDQIGTSAFNTSYNASYYVGLKWSNSQHGTTNESTILQELNDWYDGNGDYDGISSNDKNYIDSNVGFCSDREMRTGYSWSATPSSTIYYKAYERLYTNKTPSLGCSNSSDILRIPVGLITADEVAFAGGVYGTSNSNYYLYTGATYWTMSPYRFYATSSRVYVFYVWSTGELNDDRVSYTRGVRPVINLKADTLFTGSGTSSDPFEIVA